MFMNTVLDKTRVLQVSIDDHQTKRYKNGKLHCTFKAAIEYEDGSKEWYLFGRLHRDKGPAIKMIEGSPFIGSAGIIEGWYIDGRLHRDDGPALTMKDGTKEWYINGKLHRTDGPAHLTPDGDQKWYIDGLLHRDDGPAIVYKNHRFWYRKGVFLRASLS